MYKKVIWLHNVDSLQRHHHDSKEIATEDASLDDTRTTPQINSNKQRLNSSDQPAERYHTTKRQHGALGRIH